MLDEGISGDTLEERADYMMGLLRTQLANGDKEVNVTGFSRGSLTALVFLNKIAQQIGKDPLFDGIVINQTILFDTVAATKEDFPHDLPANLNYAHQPLHLIAIDEQRKAFFAKDVLDVQGALQIGFRGVHSNVGGGHNNNSLSSDPLNFVRQMMEGCKMNVFNRGTIWKYMSRYGMVSSDAVAAPTDNSTWYYKMGHRDFSAGMFLSPGFMFRKKNLKNNVPDTLKLFDSEDQRLWSERLRYMPNKGWTK